MIGFDLRIWTGLLHHEIWLCSVTFSNMNQNLCPLKDNFGQRELFTTTPENVQVLPMNRYPKEGEKCLIRQTETIETVRFNLWQMEEEGAATATRR